MLRLLIFPPSLFFFALLPILLLLSFHPLRHLLLILLSLFFCFSFLFHLCYFVSTFPIFCCFFYSLFFPRFATFPPCSLFPSFLCLVSVPSSAPLLSLLLPFHFAPSAAASASPSAFLALPLLSTPANCLNWRTGHQDNPNFSAKPEAQLSSFFWLDCLSRAPTSFFAWVGFLSNFSFFRWPVPSLFNRSFGSSIRPFVIQHLKFWEMRSFGQIFFSKEHHEHDSHPTASILKLASTFDLF